MNDSLVRLIKIRELRELTAANRLHHCQTQLQACLQQRQHQKDLWDEYHCWRLDREQSLFESLRGNLVSAREIADFRAELKILREQEAGLTTQLQQADQAVENANEALAKAHLLLLKAAKAKEKLYVYKAICQCEAQKKPENYQS